MCHFLELATKARTYPKRSVAVVTTHYAQMVWLQHCVDYVGRRICGGKHPILFRVATLDRLLGLQAQVIFASLVSHVPGIMSDVWRADTRTSRAQSELYPFGRFTPWGAHPTADAWIAAVNAVQWQVGSGAVSTTLELARVLREVGVINGVREGTTYRLGGRWWGTGEALEEGKRARDHWGYAPGHAYQLLDWEQIKANTLKKALAVQVRDPLGNIVTPKSLGVTLLDFNEWVLPYVLVEGDGQDVWN